MTWSLTNYIFNAIVITVVNNYKTKKSTGLNTIPEQLLHALPDPLFCQPASKLAFISPLFLKQGKGDLLKISYFFVLRPREYFLCQNCYHLNFWNWSEDNRSSSFCRHLNFCKLAWLSPSFIVQVLIDNSGKLHLVLILKLGPYFYRVVLEGFDSTAASTSLLIASVQVSFVMCKSPSTASPSQNLYILFGSHGM